MTRIQRLTRTTWITTAALVLLTVTFLPAQQAQRRFGLDDFTRVVRVADPQISPDAKSITIVVSRANLDENRYDAELRVVDIASGTAKALVTGIHGLNSPRWAPDGSRIAFLGNPPGTTQLQVWTVAASGGQPQAITSAPRGVQQIAWSPDSQWIAFAAQDDPAKKEGYERHNSSFEVTPNTNYTMTAAVPPTHLWVVSLSAGVAKRMTSGEQSLPVSRPPGAPASGLTWTPDGKAVLFTRGGGGRGGGLQTITVADGTVTSFTGIGGVHPQFAPGGQAIAAMNGGNLMLSPGPGVAVKNLTQPLDRNLHRSLWLDSKSLLVGGNDTERVSLWVQPVDGVARKLDLGDLSPNSSFFVDMNIGKDGSVAFTGTSPTRPSELYYMPSINGPVRRLTDVNGELASVPLGKTDTVDWKFENFSENGTLTYPPDFDPTKKYPLVLLIHGGPTAASMRTFSAGAQLMAAKGWLVFQPNYRGSDNLGNAYRNAIRGDAGAGPGRDVIAGINAIKARGIVDESRMAVSGWSYGGYMTTWMLGHYPDMWKAAVTGASVTNRLDQYNLGDGANRGNTQSSPWHNPEVMEQMRQQSPITNAHKIKAPTLILHMVGDYRVTITQSYQLYHALVDGGVTTQFIAYPINLHNAPDPVNQRDVQRRWIGWLELYLNAPVDGKGGGGR